MTTLNSYIRKLLLFLLSKLEDKEETMSSLLLSFEDSKTRDKFVTILRNLNKDTQGYKLIQDTLDKAKFDHIVQKEDESHTAIFVSNVKMIEGTLQEMRNRFSVEVISHSAPVELKEMRDGKWVTIQSRRPQ